MADLYRKTALERLSSTDQIDKAVKITSPMSWLALVVITVMIVVTIVWSILGTIPVTVTTSGIVASPVSTNAVYTPESGKVDAVLVHSDSELHLGTPVIIYRTGNGDVRAVYSDQVGTVTSIRVKVDDEINQGGEILRLSPVAVGKQVIVCYVKLSDAKKIERGMKANITLSSAESRTYGHMCARVINIDSFASTTAGMAYVVGKDNNLAATFQKDNTAVVAVTCELYPDFSARSGYFWSNEKGKSLEVKNGSLVEAKIITEEIAPITKLFTKLKELWGD